MNEGTRISFSLHYQCRPFCDQYHRMLQSAQCLSLTRELIAMQTALAPQDLSHDQV